MKPATMFFSQVEPKPIDDASTNYTSTTPPETLADDSDLNLLDADPLSGSFATSSVPWPGSTFIIRAASTGAVITLLDGQIILQPPGGRGSIHWACVESKGWLGFRNPVSGRYLGHDDNSRVRCTSNRHLPWEYFCVRLRPEGGYLLLMTHYERLWPLGIREEKGVQKLSKMGIPVEEGMVWEFVKV